MSPDPLPVPAPCREAYDRYAADLGLSALAASTRTYRARCVRRFLRWLPAATTDVNAVLTRRQPAQAGRRSSRSARWQAPVTPAEALVGELRERGLGGEVAGDWVRVTVPGLPLTPLLITPASRAGTGPAWCWRRGGRSWSHPRDDPADAAGKIAASLQPPPGLAADPP